MLVPSATFRASAPPIAWAGAIPVFCESKPERVGIDPADMERKITSRTRAVVVHLRGLPARMSGIRALAERRGLRIVEDASHAHDATWRGRPYDALGAALSAGAPAAVLHGRSLRPDRTAPCAAGTPVPHYDPEDLPATRAGRETLMKLPAFPKAPPELLDQYTEAFEKVLRRADAIASSEAVVEHFQQDPGAGDGVVPVDDRVHQRLAKRTFRQPRYVPTVEPLIDRAPAEAAEPSHRTVHLVIQARPRYRAPAPA